jgi:hypothetical protein
VADEFPYGEQVFDFEKRMNDFDLMSNRFDEIGYGIAYGIDYFVVNCLCEDATGSYTTAAGGFTSPGNIDKIFGDLIGKVAGYADSYRGLFLIIENTDVTGLVQKQVATGFSYADMALNNGFLTSYIGVDIYVVRTGTFVSTTIGSRSDITNSGHRVFGVKGCATYASPRGVTYDEKGVSGKTGKEICGSAYCGFKLWTQKAGLVVDITLA